MSPTRIFCFTFLAYMSRYLATPACVRSFNLSHAARDLRRAGVFLDSLSRTVHFVPFFVGVLVLRSDGDIL